MMTKEEALQEIQEIFDNYDWMVNYKILDCRQDHKAVAGMILCIWHLRLRTPDDRELALSCGENLEAKREGLPFSPASDHVNPYTDWGIRGVWDYDYNCYEITRTPDNVLDEFMNDAFGDEIREIISCYAYDANVQKNQAWADKLVGKTIQEVNATDDTSFAVST